MTVSANWHNLDKTIIDLTFHGRWYWKELNDAVTTIHDLAKTSDKPFDLLVDISDSSLFEPNAIEYVRSNYLTLIPPNLRLILCVGADYYTQVLWKVFTDLPMGRALTTRFFENEQQAVEFSRTYVPPS